MYIANQQRIAPEFLRFNNPIEPPNKDASSFIPFTNEQILVIEEKLTYLANSISQIFLQQYCVLFAFFAVLKIVSLIIKLYFKKYLKQNCSVNTNEVPKNIIYTGMRRTIEFLQNMLSLKSILMTFFGSNLIFFAFTFSVQLRLEFRFTYRDKLNVIATQMLGFAIIAFTTIICMHHSVFLYDSNKKLKFSKSKPLRNIYFREKRENYALTMITHGKCVADGFIHGYFLQDNQLQYVLLIVVKTILLANMCAKKWIIKRKQQYYLSVVYYLFGIGIDALCFCSKLGWVSRELFDNFYDGWSYLKLMQVALAEGLLLTVVVHMLTQIWCEIAESFCKNNSHEEKPQKGIQIVSMRNKIAS